MLANPNLYNIGNWITSGTFDTAKDAVTVDPSHPGKQWKASANIVSLGFGAYHLAGGCSILNPSGLGQPLSRNLPTYGYDGWPEINNNQRGYPSFSAYKKTEGSAGVGKEWHHIVEQSQVTKSGFAPESIHNTGNMVSIDATVHRKISGYYSSKQPFTNGMTVRDWLANQDFKTQYEFGLSVLEMFRNK